MVATNGDSHARVLDVLRDHWGYTSFRSGQQQIVSAVLSGRDVVAVMPTGFGKSLCYQLPAVLCEGTCVVVSPLIALMHDQVDRLRRRRIAATCINSSCSSATIRNRWKVAGDGKIKMLYVSPEQLGTDRFRDWLGKQPVSFVAVDEAHCITEWGHAFRPAYRAIRHWLHPTTQIVAVTATATRSVRRDIARSLRLVKPLTFVGGFDRPNIFWDVRCEVNRETSLLQLLSDTTGSVIVYAPTRRGASRWCSWLAGRGFDAVSYHAGMAKQDRANAMVHWLSNARCVMVATSAFGMGVDHPTVRLVVHLGMPGSISAYYQEAGRAGRDGGAARAVLLYRSTDIPLQRAIISRGFRMHGGGRDDRASKVRISRAKARAHKRLAGMQRYVHARVCRRNVLLAHFGESAPTACGACDVCVSSRLRRGFHMRTPDKISLHEPHGDMLVRELIDAGQLSEEEVLRRNFGYLPDQRRQSNVRYSKWD